MATAMISITLMLYHTLACLTLITPSYLQQASDEIDSENYLLNLHYDHCKKPMTFTWRKLKCECPPPLTKSGHDCICDNCVYEDIKQWHHEGKGSDLPMYINEVFEEIDEELQDGDKPSQNNTEEAEPKEEHPRIDYGEMEITRTDHDLIMPDLDRLDDEDDHFEEYSKRRRRRSLDENTRVAFFEPIILNVNGRLFLIHSPARKTMQNPWRNRVLNRWYFDRDLNVREKEEEGEEDGDDNRRSAKKGRILWRLPKRPANEDHLSPEQRMLFPRARLPMDMNKKKVLKVKGRPVQPSPSTFTDSVVAGTIEGSTGSGHDSAQGLVSSFRGTGALALGTGGGSAGASAFTGLGTSDLVITSKGASAKGQAFIGEKAKGGTSTTSLLLGSGDAIAVNSLGGRGSSSAAGFSTKYAAGGSTSAFGPASASISATPGKGAASSSAAFNEGLDTSASVLGEGGTVIESSAIGDANQDISQLISDTSKLFRSKPIRVEPTELDFDSLFNKKRR